MLGEAGSESFDLLIGYILPMRGKLSSRRAVLMALAVVAAGAPSTAMASAQSSLTAALTAGMRQTGSHSGAYVMDLTTGKALFSRKAHTGRLPASVEKLYTTSTALARFGPNSTLSTRVLGVGIMSGSTFKGTLYLRGGGDPTFGSGSFDHSHYHAGATVQRLVTNLVRDTGLRSLQGKVIADESYFDSRRGTPASGYAPNFYLEGELSALIFNRGWSDSDGAAFYRHPALESGQRFVSALRAAGVHVPRSTSVRAGKTPPTARLLTMVHSPRIAKLVALTNTPSDNFFAETLLKDLGARFARRGTTPAGVTVVRQTIAGLFKLHPRFNDGSGLSYYDRTSPFDIVSLLRQQAHNPAFTGSLAVAGRTGTLAYEMNGTYAQGRCRGKTGTLRSVSNVVGYCHSRDGHTLAYAFLLNGVDPAAAHPVQNRMEVAVARYDG
jgi:D-alanyl-D-alanine carboxypeptidase/D-alanyl-D-alanine-endopeptidase (penicillin-binding protein 4)